jgi:hypothetical protein
MENARFFIMKAPNEAFLINAINNNSWPLSNKATKIIKDA